MQHDGRAAQHFEFLRRRFRQHLQLFVLHNVIGTVVAAAKASLGDPPSQELAFCRGAILEEVNEPPLPNLPHTLLAYITGEFVRGRFLNVDVHDGEMLQLPQFPNGPIVNL